MAGERTVRIILTGDTAGLVTAFEKAGFAADATEAKLQRMQTVGRGMSTLGRSMTMVAAPLVAIGAYSVKTAASFQQSMQLIRTQAGQSQAEVNRMSQSILNLAPQVGSTTQDLAGAAYHVESAGYHGAQALKMLTVAAEGAKVGNANLVDVTNAMDAAVVSGAKGVQNYQQAMGALNATVGAGDMTMQDLADALSTGLLGPMKTYGVSLRDVGAALAVFGDNNIRGQEAATKLSSAIRIMAAPSNAAAKALGSIGLTQTQLATDMRGPGGLLSAFKDLKQHLIDSGETASQQALTVTRAFGGRQSTGVQLLLGQIPRLQSKLAEVTRGAVGFGSAWQTTQKNVAFQWDKLKATAQVALVHLGNALMPIVTRYLPPLVDGIKSVFTWLSHLPKPVLDIVVAFTAFLAIGGPILMFMGSLITSIGTIRAAFSALGFSMEINPVFIALAALVAATVLVITHFQQVKQAVLIVFKAIGSAATTVGTVLASVFSTIWHVISWPFVEGFKIIKRVFNAIVAGARWAVNTAKGVLKTLGFGGNGVMSYINPVGMIGHGLSALGLHTGGLVKPRYYDAGGPVGSDTVPAWLTPGEFVLNRAATARIGIGTLQALNDGINPGGGGITIAPGQVTLKLDGRQLAEAVVYYTLKRNARGATSLSGGGLMTGSVTG